MMIAIVKTATTVTMMTAAVTADIAIRVHKYLSLNAALLSG